ncbi:MAG: GDP-mannose 4,6-dehydratase [Planctomycetota bacterium]
MTHSKTPDSELVPGSTRGTLTDGPSAGDSKINLITGGAGFIGSHLAEVLLARGDRVLIVDDLSTGQTKNLDHLLGHERLEYIEGSVSDDRLVAEVVGRCDVVYHLAAAVGVALIAKQPIQTIERNIYPTQLILDRLGEQARRGKFIPCFIASTSEVYGKNPKSVWSEEDDLVFGATTKPRWSYGVSKAIDEFLALAFHKEKQLPVVVGRFFNVVGPRQTGAYGMVLPRFVAAALEGRNLVVHDDGRQERCFAHVNDVVSAVVQLVETPVAHGRVYNIGSDSPISILDLAKKVISRVNASVEIEYQSYADAYDESFEDIRRRVPDLSRIRSTIDYSPTHNLDTVIDDVAEEMKSATP